MPGYFHTVVYDLQAEAPARAASIAALLRCVRARVFANELELPFLKEEDEFDGTSRHVLALSACGGHERECRRCRIRAR